jgi:aldehyde:ferredoxin oxidoreductase
MDVAEVMQAGERAFTRKRLFNARLGISRKDDILPPRFLTLLPQGEGLTNQHPPIGRLLADYYQYRGWDEMGIPTGAKVDELGLGSCAVRAH